MAKFSRQVTLQFLRKLSGEYTLGARERHLQNTSLPPTDAPALHFVYEPGSLHPLRQLAAQLTQPAEQAALDFA
jgi:hypothetical protein